MKRNQNVAPISDFELCLVRDVSRATFPAGTAAKRFIGDISAQSKLSDRGRCFLAFIANRFRRQYSLSPDQWAWVNEWLAKDHTLEGEPKSPEPAPKPLQIVVAVEELKQLEADAMILPHFTDSLWWLLIAIECLTLCTALARKVYDQYPLFVIYVAFACVRSFALRALLNNDVGYFWVHWMSGVFGDVLLVGVMVELGKLLFAPYWIIPLEPKRAFKFCLMMLLSASAILPIVSRTKVQILDWDYFFFAFARTMNRSVNLMIFGTMLLGIVLSIYLSIPWRRVATYLAGGLLMKFGVETWLWFCLLDAPRQKVMDLQWVTISASISAFGIWMAACFVPEHSPVVLTEDQLDSFEHAFGFVSPLPTSSKELI